MARVLADNRVEFNEKELEVQDALGSFVHARYQAARDSKKEIHEEMLDCLRLMRDEELTCSDGTDDVKIAMNITAPIIRGIVGLLRDIFGGSVDEPYVIRPTPVPELDANATAELRKKVVDALPQLEQESGGSQEAIVEGLSSMRRAFELEQSRLAVAAAEAMSLKVRDRLVDAEWTAAFGDEFLLNFVMFPAAIMKTPSMRVKKWKKWNAGRMEVSNEIIPVVENISPFDFYLAPGAADIANAEYVLERRRISYSELRALAGTDSYWMEGVLSALEQMPDGYVDTEGDYKARGDSTAADEHEPTIVDGYDTIGYYGKVRGALLKEFGIEDVTEDDNYEAEIWCIRDVVIKAVLNSDPLQKRPFLAASYEPIPGQFWGSCPTLRLRDIQKVCTATIKALIRNMAFASGPIGEVDIDRVEEDGDPRELAPWQLKLVNGGKVGGSSGTAAYRFHDVNSHANELLAVFDKFLGTAYEVIGIPRVAFGSPTGLGETGRTQGGMAIIMNQASKSIKSALRVLERNIIEPTVQGFIDFEMTNSADAATRGDIRVYARAVSGILEQENKRGKLEWALQSLGPLMQIAGPDGQPMVPPAAPLRLLAELFKLNGIPTQGILPDFDMQDAISATAPKPVAPSFGVPQLDGRSAAAQGAIQGMNSLTGAPNGGAV